MFYDKYRHFSTGYLQQIFILLPFMAHKKCKCLFNGSNKTRKIKIINFRKNYKAKHTLRERI